MLKEIGDKVPEAQKDAYKQQVEPALNSLETSRKAFNDGLSSAGSDDTENACRSTYCFPSTIEDCT